MRAIVRRIAILPLLMISSTSFPSFVTRSHELSLSLSLYLSSKRSNYVSMLLTGNGLRWDRLRGIVFSSIQFIFAENRDLVVREPVTTAAKFEIEPK